MPCIELRYEKSRTSPSLGQHPKAGTQELSGDDRYTDTVTVTDVGSFQALLHLGRGPS